MVKAEPVICLEILDVYKDPAITAMDQHTQQLTEQTNLHSSSSS
jgi:hypothetical protein